MVTLSGLSQAFLIVFAILLGIGAAMLPILSGSLAHHYAQRLPGIVLWPLVLAAVIGSTYLITVLLD